jgi:GNAT superfamily N-acetyltransferase
MMHRQSMEQCLIDGIVPAATSTELNDARTLMQAFVSWHRMRHVEDTALINRYFDQRAFGEELSGLPGKYARPRGSLLIAYQDGAPAGCVALRDLGSGLCEMKRMFVAEPFRKCGIGGALAARVIAEAEQAGYRAMRLDTSKRQREAIRLYQRLGFEEIPAYYALPKDMEEWLVFFERKLRS